MNEFRNECTALIDQVAKLESMSRRATDMGWGASTWTAVLTATPNDIVTTEFTAAMTSVNNIVTAFIPARAVLEHLRQ
jgi:hypothetical protein